MNTLKTLVLTEIRLRVRRLSTLVTLFVVIAFAWWLFADQSNGYAFIVIHGARVLNTSAALALGSVAFFSLAIGLAGFYLSRGRIGEDVRCGTGGVIGASSISNAKFLLCRWLGGVGYLLVMSVVFMLSIMLCHLIRGVGPIQPLVYAETYALILLPIICFSVSCAVLFDSVAPLMGKMGDVIYFFVWVAQLSVMSAIGNHDKTTVGYLYTIDFTGLLVTVQLIYAQFHSMDVAIGYATFDQALPALTMRSDLWSWSMVPLRLVSCAIASLILLPAFVLFHRYRTDRVKVSHTNSRRSPVEILNQLARPLGGLVQPMFKAASRNKGIAGRVLADVALTLSTSPIAIPILIALAVCAVFVKLTMLPGVLLVAVACWGVLISDMSTRDYASGCEDMTGVVTGGVYQRYLRQFFATFVIGLLFAGLVILRIAIQHPSLGLAALVGLLSLSALASMCGRTSRTSRLFLSLFLFWLYIAIQTPKVPMLDVAGFNGAANAISTLVYFCIGIIALMLGYGYNRWVK